MTDPEIYLGQKKPSPVGCILVVLLIAAMAGGVLWWRSCRREAPAPAPAPAPAKAAPTAAAPQAPAAAPSASAPAPAPTPGLDIGLQALDEARQLKGEGKLVEARDRGWQILDASSNHEARTAAEALLGELHIELVSTPRMMPEKVEYTVQPGDSLDGLAKKFGTTVDLIRKGNRITGSVIRAGDRMRIFNGKFRIVVDKSDNTLVLLMNDKFFKRYAVGTGEYGRTPTGDFTIRERIPQPTWWRPDGKAVPFGDTNNVLGTHWLSLDIPGYGIHGTWEPETIGKQASAGCIRLLNSEIEELFGLVPVGTPVTIED